MDIVDLSKQKEQLDEFCSNALVFVSDLVKTIQLMSVEKLNLFTNHFKQQLKQQQSNFRMLKGVFEYNQSFNELKVQIKNKLDCLQALQFQINNLNGDVIIEEFTKFNSRLFVDHKYAEQIENFNRRQLFVCQKCLMKFDTQQDFEQHNHNKQVSQEQPIPENGTSNWLDDLVYTCSQCKKVLRGIMTARRHLRMRHELVDWYQCGYCDVKSFQAMHIAQHCMKVHSRTLYDKPPVPKILQKHLYDCPFTKKTFNLVTEVAQYIHRTLNYHLILPDGFDQYKNANSFEFDVVLDL